MFSGLHLLGGCGQILDECENLVNSILLVNWNFLTCAQELIQVKTSLLALGLALLPFLGGLTQLACVGLVAWLTWLHILALLEHGNRLVDVDEFYLRLCVPPIVLIHRYPPHTKEVAWHHEPLALLSV